MLIYNIKIVSPQMREKKRLPSVGRKSQGLTTTSSRVDRIQRKLDVHPCSSSMYGMLSKPPKNSPEIYGQNLNFKISVMKQPLISPLIFGKVCEPDLCGSFRTTPTAGRGISEWTSVMLSGRRRKLLQKTRVFDGFLNDHCQLRFFMSFKLLQTSSL